MPHSVGYSLWRYTLYADNCGGSCDAKRNA